MDGVHDMGGDERRFGRVDYEPPDAPVFHEDWHRKVFAMGALYGFREDDLIEGIKPFNPLDVLDSALTAWRGGAFQLNTWTV